MSTLDTQTITHFPPNPTKVRMASKDDEDEIFGLLVMLHAENGMFRLNREKVRNGIRLATERRGGLIGITDEGPRAVGCVLMVITSDWYSDDPYLHELCNFVHPEFRRSNYAVQQIEFSKWCADSLGLMLQMGIVSNIRTEPKVRLYRRRMSYAGAFFWHAPERSTKFGGNGKSH